MNEHYDGNAHGPEQNGVEVDLVALILDIQKKLVFLERKIDTLVAQSQARPSFRDRNFQKGPRSFGPSQHYRPGDRGGQSRDRNFENRPRSEDRSFEHKRPFDKRDIRNSSSFSQKKKPSFYKRKDR